ncbi:MAG TPA: hypothetical protein VK694_00405 [Verrucomicrobiae bacterium]|nr:hypothetical protein [Verrucomicrobiae bacterium]
MPLAEPLFLYPNSRRFLFDKVCDEIVRALEARNWDVPGILVNFRTFGTGAAKYRMVSEIQGADFKVTLGCHTFHGSQSVIGATEVIIPRQHIMVYHNWLSPVYYVYAGTDWLADKERWVSVQPKSSSKADRVPRWYLRYTGDCFCNASDRRHTHAGSGPSLLVHTSDNFEYDPVGDEPTMYDTDEVFEDFAQWLRSNLLDWILRTPEATEKVNAFPQINTPLPDGIPPIFCFGDKEDYLRVLFGQNVSVEPDLRYGMAVGNYSLLCYPVLSNAPREAYSSFLWCGFGEVQTSTHLDELVIPGLPWQSPLNSYVFRVVPKRAEGIYVADNSPYVSWYHRLSRRDLLSSNLGSAEREIAGRTRAASLMQIATYPGLRYQQPIVLINRELELDEVEIVSGPWST